jgi:hypothetical protein
LVGNLGKILFGTLLKNYLLWGRNMIENEQQYIITKTLARKFEQSLIKIAKKLEDTKPKNYLLWEVKKSALESQLNDFQQEIENYELLNFY